MELILNGGNLKFSLKMTYLGEVFPTMSEALYNRPGPNRLKKSDVYHTTDVTQAVKIRMAKEGLGAEEPLSIPGLLKRSTYEADVHQTEHKAFIKLGMSARSSVGVLRVQCAEWFIIRIGMPYC
ncbi:hypothetical protein DOY81_009073 [Sarcophaga bullata]|nr:hypothetical protein DOY81_009073 [Sarcophaga bullata]